MGRFLGWALGFGCVLAISAAPAAAQVHVSVGVHGGGFGGHVSVGYPPIRCRIRSTRRCRCITRRRSTRRRSIALRYYPAYRPVYRAAYRPVYRPAYGRVYGPAYRPVYGQQVAVVQGRHDNGKHNGWYKNGKQGRGPQHGR